MKTYSFIGSDKNAGKTTAFNFIYHQLKRRDSGTIPICLTSIGINGEPVDSYENKEKPFIRILRDTLFITAGEHLNDLGGLYTVLATFNGSLFPKTYVLATALDDFEIVLEGPNEKKALLEMKKNLYLANKDVTCLIDGSIDRQFLGHPSISDGIYFALLLSKRPEQQKKARDLLSALELEPCNNEIKLIIDKHKNDKTTSLLCKTNGDLVFQSSDIPFLDSQLKTECLKMKDESSILYLNGSLTPTLYDFLVPFPKLAIILDNYTCYQNIAVQEKPGRTFKPGLYTYHLVPLTCLFLKQEDNHKDLTFPHNIPVYNLFRDEPNEIGI